MNRTVWTQKRPKYLSPARKRQRQVSSNAWNMALPGRRNGKATSGSLPSEPMTVGCSARTSAAGFLRGASKYQ